uniref:Large ribosomal subunit protein uL29c n=1 Tax=Physcomitrium patens TaxID=3218 RepID=A0A2K1JDX7_PHYPA|nr:hypothetical protein PHYPA_020004 [Physcomitrium patens]
MACVADVSRAAVCASGASVSSSIVKANATPRVSISASPFFCPGVKSLSASASPARGVVRTGAPLVVEMAKREEELVAIRNMSDEDINQTVVDLKGEMFLLRTKQATPTGIARMLTVKREREIERGVSIRESRKLDREWKRNIVIRPPPSYAASLAEQEKK